MSDTKVADRMAELIAKGEAEEGDYLINGVVYDPNSMSFGEMRQVRAICRDELWDSPDDDYDPEQLSAQDVAVAMCLVFMRRDNPAVTLEDAMGLRYFDVLVTKPSANGAAEDVVPPTSRTSSARSRAKSTRATGGHRS